MSMAMMKLLAIPGVHDLSILCCMTKAQYKVIDRLGLSYSTSQELNKTSMWSWLGLQNFIVKKLLSEVNSFEFNYCNIIKCIQALFDNPEFSHDLIFAPEWHYTNSMQTCHIYSKMHTGDWWWSVQVCIWPYSEIKLICDTRWPWKHIVLVQLSSWWSYPQTKHSLPCSMGRQHIPCIWP